MKRYQTIYASVILTAFGVGLISLNLRPYCAAFLFGLSVGWIIHLIGTGSTQRTSE